ncbi:MAG: hypothetical protein EZS28_031457 [Streblomastix strix]|uniref:Uncharacterized protein n=1 Tax=Streblomastix strix TaxID=222440 RepID=A0A5J4UTH5_9EUKA|nr:MAG: hypothetical protein EZS28_031457 [Streblomastix strix]
MNFKDPKPGDFRYKYGQVKFRKQKQKEGFDLSGQDAAYVIDTELFFDLLKKKPGQRSSDAELKASVVYLSEQMNLKPARENRSTDRNNNRRILELVEGKGQLTRELEIVIREKLDAIHALQDQRKTTPDIDWMENELQKLLLKEKLP